MLGTRARLTLHSLNRSAIPKSSPALRTLSARLRLFLFLMPVAAIIILIGLPVLELIARAMRLL